MFQGIYFHALLNVFGLMMTAWALGFICTYALRRLFRDEEFRKWFIDLAPKVGLIGFCALIGFSLLIMLNLFSTARDAGTMPAYIMLCVTEPLMCFAFFWGFLSGVEGRCVRLRELFQYSYYFRKE